MSKKRRKTGKTGKTPTRRIKKPTESNIGNYLGLAYESFCELSCLYFAEELIQQGYVRNIQRSPSYMLCDPVQSTYAIQLKRGSKQDTQTISQGVSYTPDFDIYFTEKAVGVFCWVLGSGKKWEKNQLVAQPTPFAGIYKACCEVKPDFQRASTTPKSVQSMKWLMQKHGVFVNLFRPNRMFAGLFVPDKYRLNERGYPRALKFKALTLKQYVDGKRENHREGYRKAFS